MLHNPVSTMPEPQEATMSFTSLINSLGGKTDSSTHADSFCRIDEFDNTDDFGAVHVTGDNVGYQALQELNEIFDQLRSKKELNPPLLVSYLMKAVAADGVPWCIPKWAKSPLSTVKTPFWAIPVAELT